MAKLSTISHLQDELDKDFSWRVKELSTIKTSLSGVGTLAKSTMIRAGVALLYAHWEGFIKLAASNYLNYILCQGFTIAELKDCFAVLALKKHLDTITLSKKAMVNLEAIEFIRSKAGSIATFNISSAINTESNLSSTVFANIANTIGVDPAPYAGYNNLLDKRLLERRNKIAHGEYIDISADEWKSIMSDVLIIMRGFKTDIQNAATMSDFKM